MARSEGWPAWLRLLLVRPIAYAAERGIAFPREPLDELRRSPDPAVVLWATAAVALMDPAGPATSDLERACGGAGPDRELACLLRDAARSGRGPEAAERSLDRATAWLRAHHAGAAALWDGWEVAQAVSCRGRSRYRPRNCTRGPAEPTGTPSRSHPIHPHAWKERHR